MPYPPAPWKMYGESWNSLFRVKEGDHPDRPKGMYGVMMVRYDDPSPLTYHELLVGRMVDKEHVTITDIWVDSADSVEGGRALWAIPKELNEYTFEARENTISTKLNAAASIGGRAIASCSFYDVAGAAPRLPFNGRVKQTRDNGEIVTAGLKGSAKIIPCHAKWQFAPEGPLGWLHGKRPVASARMRRFRMDFG